MLSQKTHHGHQESRRAEAALQTVAFVKRLLDGVQRRARRGKALDCRHLVALGLNREHQARADRRTVEQDRAAAAYAVLAADVGAGQAEVVAEVVRE
jgi:hypothetical protein